MSFTAFANEKERLVAEELARHDLYDFARLMMLENRRQIWMRAPHHPLICDALMRVVEGKCRRLIICIPPRYSKTELVMNMVTWGLGHYPDSEFILTSYSDRLAGLNSWKARETVNSEAFRRVFPDCVIDNRSQARDEWRTTAGGCVYAVGAGGTITGYGAGKMRDQFGGAIIIDDILKAQDAKSDVIRPGVLEWYQDTLQSRLNDPHRTPIVVIMQRLHEDDLAGWLMAGGTGEEWEVIELPAIAGDNDPLGRAPGEPLWPEKHNLENLARLQRASPLMFATQYLQRPTPPEGGVFMPDQIDVIHEHIDCVQWVRAWDIAATDEDGDWTVGALLGRLKGGRFLIGDIVRFQGRPDVVEARMKSTAAMDGKRVMVSIPQDPGAGGKFQAAYLARALAGYRVHVSPEPKDKLTRAEPIASQVNMANVSMRAADWNAPLKHEMRNFPFGKHDDQVDALSRAFNVLCEETGPIIVSDDLLMAAKRMPPHRIGARAL